MAYLPIFITLFVLLQSNQCANFCLKKGNENKGPHWEYGVYYMANCMDPNTQDIPEFEGLRGFQPSTIMYDATWWNFEARDNNDIKHTLSVDLWTYPEQNIVFTNKGEDSPEYIFTPYYPPQDDGKLHFLQIPITPKTKISLNTNIKDWEQEWLHFIWKEIKTEKYGEQLSFPYRIDYEPRQFPEDVKALTIEQFLNDQEGYDMANQLIDYIDYIQNLARQQLTSLKAIERRQVYNGENIIVVIHYYHPFHARLFENQWLLFDWVDSESSCVIPLMGMFEIKVENPQKNPKHVCENEIYKFHFVPDEPNKLVIEDIQNALLYEIWWFPQTRGQCVFHSLQAILQGESLTDAKTDNYQSCNDWVINSQDLLSDLKKPHGKDECKCFIPGRIYLNELNMKDIDDKRQCIGAFPLCFVEKYLLNKGYKLVIKRKKSLKKNEKWYNSFQEFLENNNKLEPLGIIMLIPGHVKAFRKIIPKGKDGKPVKDHKGIWVDLDSGYSPKQVTLKNMFAEPGLGRKEADIMTIWLVYGKDEVIIYKKKKWAVIGLDKFVGTDNNKKKKRGFFNLANNEYDNHMVFDDYDYEEEEKVKNEKSIFYSIINIMAIYAIYGLILIIITSFLFGFIISKLIISSNDFNIINNDKNNKEDWSNDENQNNEFIV